MQPRLPFILARRFVAAETLEETIPVVQDLNRKGMRVALDVLGEYVDDRKVALSALDTYIHVLRTAAGAGPTPRLDANISIKLSMLGQKIDLDFCLENLRRLLTVAKEHDVFVRLDMEGSDMTDSTLSLFETVLPEYPDHVGIVLQAYLKRTAKDIDRMCELQARVRLCKGAYREPAEIAYQRMPEIRERYIAYMKQLISYGRFPGIATHDELLIGATKAYVREEGIGNDRFEFQMLYGMRPARQQEIAAEGYGMRVYVPYGTQWFPYYYRRLRERKENIWFVVKNLVKG